MKEILLSIVTINFNSGNAARRTVDSVLSKDLSRCEWIVIDGGSRDVSLQIFSEVRTKINHLVSEPDGGIADAMNKGLRASRGAFVMFMNAGDSFEELLDMNILLNLIQSEDFDILLGGASFFAENGHFLYTRTLTKYSLEDLLFPICRIIHPSTLVKRELLLAENGFDPDYRVSMDYHLWLRLLRVKPRIYLYDGSISRFFRGGASNNLWRRYKEDFNARFKLGYHFPLVEIKSLIIVGLKLIFSFASESRMLLKLKDRIGI